MNYKVVVSPEYERFRPHIDRLIAEGKPEDAEVIYCGRNVLYKTKIDGVTFVVKQFRKPHFVNSIVYTNFRSSKAARSFANARRMLELGFNTPAPVAYAEARSGFRLIDSIYVSLELRDASELRQWERRADADELVQALGAEMYRLMKAGVWHKDFSPGNVLFTGLGDSGYVFHYVDLNRMQFDVRNRAKLMRMFRAINLSLYETAKLARVFAVIAGEDPDRTEDEALLQLLGYLNGRYRKLRLRMFRKRLIRPRKS